MDAIIYKYYKAIFTIGEIMPIEPLDPKKQLVTSLRINPDIWKDAKVQAIKNDMTLTQLVEEAINCWIKEKNKTTPK